MVDNSELRMWGAMGDREGLERSRSNVRGLVFLDVQGARLTRESNQRADRGSGGRFSGSA